MAPSEQFPNLGYGLGLRATHYPHIFAHKPKLDWFEIISENFMDTQGAPRRNLHRIRADYPIVMHGVSLSIGTVDPLNSEYLKQLKTLAQEIEPAWISDHLCWTGVAHKTTHDLLPVPYTQESLDHIVDRISQVQEYLGRRIALENPSTYLEFTGSTIAEADFIAEMAKRSGCQLLLDVNNVYVTCFNHRLDAKTYLDTLPLDHVIQLHLAGHSHMGTHIIDTHDDYVTDEVWALYRYVVGRAGHRLNTMIEWDDAIPPFEVLYAELEKAKAAASLALQVPVEGLHSEALPSTVVTSEASGLALSQHQLQHAIMHPKAPDSVAWIREKKEFPALEQLAVYRDAYRLRLRDSVAEDYPVLEKLVGAESLRTLLAEFVEATPPSHYNIAQYSTQLPDFVKTAMPTNQLAQEIAELENALTQLADTPESAPLEAAHLAQITPESFLEMTIIPRTATQLFVFTYPVNTYYEQVMAGEDVSAIPTAQQSHLAVFRHEDTVWRMALDPEEYALLRALFSGVSVGEALAQVAEKNPEATEQLSQKLTQWFARWMRNRLLATPQKMRSTVYAVA